MGKTYWMVAISQENFEITRDRGFDIQGIDSKNRRKAVRMAQDDRIVFYVKEPAGVQRHRHRDFRAFPKRQADLEALPQERDISSPGEDLSRRGPGR